MEDNKNTQNIEMRLYDLNKSIMGQMPDVDREVVFKVLNEYFDKFEDIPVYHMILAAEERDFSVFEFLDEINDTKVSEMINEIVELLESRGPIKDISMNGKDVDIWINDVFYKLFDYSWGVIPV